VPVYQLTSELSFPPPEGASDEGIVAVGGDVCPERLVLAYSQGIFPWPHEGLPLLWFSPDPRFVIELSDVRIGRSLRKRVRSEPFEIRTDTAFARVIGACANTPRPEQDGTWITPEMHDGYVALHERGVAHCVEAWEGDELVGGLYGVALGRVFCGESMFSLRDDASKVCTVALLGNLRHRGYHFVDCQVHTDHLARFGAQQWSRTRYLQALRRAVIDRHEEGPWRFELSLPECLDVLAPVSPG